MGQANNTISEDVFLHIHRHFSLENVNEVPADEVVKLRHV